MNALLRVAVEKAKTNMSRMGMGKLSEEINEVIEDIELSQRYLDETIRRGIHKAKISAEEFLNLEEAYVQSIAQYLGYIDIAEFIQKGFEDIPRQLSTCIGFWYNYVRESSGKDVILRSPVEIYQEKNKVFMALYGYHRIFKGEIELKSGCISVLLKDLEEEKSIHLVCKIGIALDPTVLQGVFSGISSTELPICGREILIRQEVDSIDKLHNAKIDLASEVPESSEWNLNVIQLLKEYQGNYIRVSETKGFDLYSLE
ncbi:MAG: hypothetical protein AAF388_03935 [Bacteroidota bacterium]